MRYALICLLFLAPSCMAVRPPVAVIVQERTSTFDPAAFERMVHALAEGAPVSPGVRVRVCSIDGPYLGMTQWNAFEGLFDIQIEAAQGAQGIVDALIHEWAHAMVWRASCDGHHDSLWGVAYARAYRVVLAGMMQPRPLPAPITTPEETPEDCD